MGFVSILVLFLLTLRSVLVSFAEENPRHPPSAENDTSYFPICPPILCEKLGWRRRHPPSNDQQTGPECRCSKGHPRVQLESEGKLFWLKNISKGNTIVIQDMALHDRLKHRRCKPFRNLTSSLPPPNYFKPVPALSLLTLFKCPRNLSNHLNTEYNYTKCNDDFIIHYSHPNHAPILPPPPECLIIRYPVNMTSGIADLFHLLTSDITLQLSVPPHCWDCLRRIAKCQCAHVKGNDKTRNMVLGFAVGGGGIAILMISFFFIRRSHKRKYALSRNTSSDPSSKPGLETGAYFGIPIFSYSELEKATNFFDPDQEIGDGGFGTVYHGRLRDGRAVAVKRLFENNYRRVEQFMNEIEILTRLRHPNLVSLYGCTSRHSRELLLVYEFIPNGTVADHLHGDRADSGLLTWPIRLSIAIETASALCYLHASDVIHRDVKTTNILLDGSFCVKVADFGLSRLFPTHATHVSTAPQGTPGYVDPEYYQCYQLTEKSDVYSFGVVLIELISSLPAVDITRHRHEINLSNYAINKIQNCAFHELMDPHLGFDTDVEVNRMTTLVAELAFRCLQPDREMRPSMDEVLEALKEIESDKHGSQNTETTADRVGSSIGNPLSPSPSPDCDEAVLLKSVQPMPSPDTVIAQWPSRSTVHSVSA